ncbi:uncharacterized protein [Salminus brasiliensis]|uniref:uncharacterized protein n=1 Tax=Salminus brasiliensis TaxID=930266 RepID=UPI003B833DAF
MWSSQTAALLLLFAVLIPVPGEGVEFPGLIKEISVCVKDRCSEEIEACEERHGEDLTDQLKGCVAKSCRGSLISCMDWISRAILAARMSEKMPLSPKALESLIETTMEILVDSYLYCFKSTDLQNTTLLPECLLGNMLDRAEPYINMFVNFFGFSDTGFVMCYLRTVVRSMASCSNGLDEDYYTKLEENMSVEMAVNRQEYVNCVATSYRGKNCFQMLTRVFGSTPAMQTQTKGLFICVINGLVVSADGC